MIFPDKQIVFLYFSTNYLFLLVCLYNFKQGQVGLKVARNIKPNIYKYIQSYFLTLKSNSIMNIHCMKYNNRKFNTMKR